MESINVKPARQSVRERLLAAAEELFYQEGVNTVGIDRVIERAGVAKASLYSNFKSKDDLVRSYLAARHESRKLQIREKLAGLSGPREKLLAVFDVMAEVYATPGFRGCAFVRASAEMRPESSAREVCDAQRGWMRTLFTDLARQAGAVAPEQLGHQLVMLYDGSAASAQLDGDLGAAAVARAAAAQLLDLATASAGA